jgi:hypothetical protein
VVVEDSAVTVASVTAAASAAAAVPPSVAAVTSGAAAPVAVAVPDNAMQEKVSGLQFLNEFICFHTLCRHSTRGSLDNNIMYQHRKYKIMRAFI